MRKSKQCLIIAEAGDQHFGSIALAKEMAKLAKLAGADCVKFQHHLPDEEMLKDVPSSSNMKEPLYDFLVRNALKIEDHKILSEYCNEIGIEYLCTPFSLKAAEELISHTNIKRFKIGSGEMSDLPTLNHIASFDLPMIISTGMSTFDEIDRTYNYMKDKVNDLSFLYCVSAYPPKYEDMNLKNIQKMIDRYPDITIGHSDHTPDLYTSFSAVTLGAKIIEKHVIIDKRMPGPDQAVSIDFKELRDLVDGIRKVEASLGDQKIIHDSEKDIRAWAYRSVVAIKPIKSGQVISPEMVWSKRPGTGIPSHEMSKVIGRVCKNDIAVDTQIKWSDLL